MSPVDNTRTEFFNDLEKWFLEQITKIESEWSDFIERYKNEAHLGRMIYFQMGRTGHSRIGHRISRYLDIPFSWDDREYTFYFNAIHADLSDEEFSRLKQILQSALGDPDRENHDGDIKLPLWTNGVITVQFWHVDTHGNGYEKIEIKIDNDYFKKHKSST